MGHSLLDYIRLKCEFSGSMTAMAASATACRVVPRCAATERSLFVPPAHRAMCIACTAYPGPQHTPYRAQPLKPPAGMRSCAMPYHVLLVMVPGAYHFPQMWIVTAVDGEARGAGWVQQLAAALARLGSAAQSGRQIHG
jgi:hypothetical protein